MNIVVKKIKSLETTIDVYGSKSAIIRYLICAYLSNQKITLHNMSYGDDVLNTISCLRKMGARIIIEDHKLILQRKEIITPKQMTLDVGASATLLRLLIPLNFVLFPNATIIYKCHDNLSTRPLDGYNDLFTRNNILVRQEENNLIVKGKIISRHVKIDASKSSQFASGILLALPLLEFDTSLEIMNLEVSRSYFSLTQKIIREFGIKTDGKSIIGNQKYCTTKKEFIMPSDFDLALVYTLIALNSGDVTLNYQGEVPAYFNTLIQCGANINVNAKQIIVHKSNVNALTLDFSDHIDTSLAFMAFACTLEEPSTFSCLERLKFKESNRLEHILEMFDTLHVDYAMQEEQIKIYPCKRKLNNLFETYMDHRLAMAQIILLSGQKGKIEISDAQVMQKSAPQFWCDLKTMGFRVTRIRRPKILLAIQDKKDLLLPADGYVVGYEKYCQFAAKKMNFEELEEVVKQKKIYLLMNALIHQSQLKELEEEIKRLSQLSLHYIVQDIGMMEILKKYVPSKNIILMPYTLICSKCDAKAYMKENIDAIGLSNEITLQDIYQISRSAQSYLAIFGYIPMYQSYRKIVSLFLEHTNLTLKSKDSLILKEETRDEYYHVEENEYGATIYRPYPINYLDYLNSFWHLKYLQIDTKFLSKEMYAKALYLVKKYYKNRLNISEVRKEVSKWQGKYRNDFLDSDSIYRREEL